MYNVIRRNEMNTVIIKKYSNRKMYCSELGRHISQEELLTSVKDGVNVKVIDNVSKEDVTGQVLTQALAIYKPLGLSKILEILKSE